jgi:hypothetical protein
VIFWWAVSVAGFSLAAYEASGTYEVVAYVVCASLIWPLERFFALLGAGERPPPIPQPPPDGPEVERALWAASERRSRPPRLDP